VAQAMPQKTEQTNHATRTVEISVNRRHVTVTGPRQTGLGIKQAAIDQGVPIELAFQLSEQLGPHQTRIVGDDDDVTVHKGSVFFAVAGDDNS
jgi:hypothetical protein